MKMRLLLLIVVVTVSLGFAACNNTGTNTNTNTAASAMSDSDLEKMIRDKINSDGQVKAANLDVSANAGKNEATLSGTVGTEALRTRAVDLARSANAGLAITNKIEVKPGETPRGQYTEEQAREERAHAKENKETIGETLDDAWIHTKIVAKLIGNTTTPERKINVDVVNGAVTLRGTVDTAEARNEAERTAKETDGVKKVNDQLKVAPAAKPANTNKATNTNKAKTIYE